MPKLTLTSLFTHKNIQESWETVQAMLKSAPFRDVIDYRDFHFFLNDKARRIRHDLLSARYRPTYSVRARSQRSKGLNRVLTYFHPEDLVVYNLLCQAVHSSAKHTYFKNAYFSRSLHSKPKEDLIKTEGSFFFEPYGGTFKQWRAFSTHRAKLGKSGTHEFVVFTDLANFFDTIHHETVRDRVAPFVENGEIVNLLMLFLDGHILRPRYSSHLRIGVPQDSFDCSRVLANLVLVGIDSLLQRRTKGQWIRWMDDITFCVHSEPEGHGLINEVSERLREDGLTLNAAKTFVMRAEDVEKNLLVQENALIDALAEKAKKGQVKSATKSLRSLWKQLSKHRDPVYWEKVVARLLGLAGALNAGFMLDQCPDLLRRYPKLHDAVFRYCESLDYDSRIVELVRQYLESGYALYEEVRVRALECLTVLALPPKDRSTALTLARKVLEGGKTRREVYSRSTAVLVIALYGNAQSHKRLLRLYESGDIAYSSQILRRHMAAALLAGKEEWHQRVLSLSMTETGDLVKDLLFFVLHSKHRNSWDKKTVASFAVNKVGMRDWKCIGIRKLVLLGMLTHHPVAKMRGALLSAVRSNLKTIGVTAPRPNVRVDALAFHLLATRG